MIHTTAFIHPLAHVDGSTVGARTKVWQYASVTGGTVLGEDCSVSPSAMLHGPVFGDRCIASGGVMMGPGFKIGNDVFLGPNAVLCNDLWPAADKDGYDAEALRSGEHWAVIVGDNAIIGAGAVVLPGVRIGKGAVVAACARAARDVPAGMVLSPDGSLSPKPANWRERRMRWAMPADYARGGIVTGGDWALVGERA